LAHRGQPAQSAHQDPVGCDGDRLEQALAVDGRGQRADVAQVGAVAAPDADGVERALEFDVPRPATHGRPRRGAQDHLGQQGVVGQQVPHGFADEQAQQDAASRGGVRQVRVGVAEHGAQHRQP
jgi:hypothetical protein